MSFISLSNHPDQFMTFTARPELRMHSEHFSKYSFHHTQCLRVFGVLKHNDIRYSLMGPQMIYFHDIWMVIHPHDSKMKLLILIVKTIINELFLQRGLLMMCQRSDHILTFGATSGLEQKIKNQAMERTSYTAFRYNAVTSMQHISTGK